MGALTNFAEGIVLTWLLRPGTGAPARPAGCFVGLSSTTPGEGGTGVTEVVTRQAVTFGAPVAGDPTEVSNTAEVAFGDPATDGSATHFVIYDAASGGNMLAFDVLRDTGGTATTVTWVGAQNTPISFPAGSLKLRLD